MSVAMSETMTCWPRHSPERRRFSVLCHRGWCDPGFKNRDIAWLIEALSGVKRPATQLPASYCHMPFTCECECHDAMKATLTGAEVTAHAEAVYRRGHGFSRNHAVLRQPLTAGRFTRQPGEALCKPTGKFWGPAPGSRGRVNCPECLSRAERYGVILP